MERSPQHGRTSNPYSSTLSKNRRSGYEPSDTLSMKNCLICETDWRVQKEVHDGSGNVFKLAAPVECKGIVGSDDRHYLLDLMRVTPRDANYTGPGSRFCILRPELITAFCQAKATERSKTKSTSQGDAHIASNSPNVDGEIQKHEKANNFSLLIP
ncbi:hypothetical protein FEM48_ZijujUnG0028900 [Ziziphus jujuba var. spinosa]|uniref:Clu domain-containing protein n=1 Tax=Ziziphus jujuba var. spinosa TaxID=714518 RepID=A0A978U9K8_ZIZJJ|nr:hypothetical protein FEM48_ZijujUnG0028900 [Ziziphus jujuba var. spinosa]